VGNKCAPGNDKRLALFQLQGEALINDYINKLALLFASYSVSLLFRLL
jgi:hypothetical protein